jgi:hypothetical protein
MNFVSETMRPDDKIASEKIIPAVRPLFRFKVSLNEEHTWLHIVCNDGTEANLGERTHHYSLLTLARQRLGDAHRGLEQDSQGWVSIEELSKMLGLDTGHLNIQIFRARRQIANALPQTTHSLCVLERRRGEIRFGAVPFQIVRGSKLEGEFLPCVEEQTGNSFCAPECNPV